MVRSMSIKRVKQIITIATVFATISCLIPEISRAQQKPLPPICEKFPRLPRCSKPNPYTPITMDFTGTPNAGKTAVEFNLNPFAMDSNKTTNVGFFKSAIQSATFICSSDNSDSFGCNDSENKFSFTSGNLIGYLVNESTVQYEGTLVDTNSNILHLGIQVFPSNPNYTSTNLLDFSLANLNQYLTQNPEKVKVAALLNNPRPFSDGDFLGGFYVDVVPEPPGTTIPEPDGAGSLLGAGATIALLLKRRKHSIKISHNRTSSKINDMVAVSLCKEG